MAFNVTVGNRTIQFNNFYYTKYLNKISVFELNFDVTSSAAKTNAQTENNITIYRNGNIDFFGKINQRETTQGGLITISGHGIEIEMEEVNCPVDSDKSKRVYNDETDESIISDLASQVPDWSFDFSNSTATSISSFRTSESMSVWNGIMRVKNQTGKDIEIDQPNRTLYLHDSKGSSNVFEFVEGKDITQPAEKIKKPQAKKVIVFGKGDGDSQARGEAGSGTPVRKITDRNIITDSEANDRAQKELNKIKQERKHYAFKTINPDHDIEVGDEGYMTAQSVGLSRTGVDVVKVKRSVLSNGEENLILQTTNPELREAEKSLAEEITGSIGDRIRDNSAMKGSGNTLTFPGQINANDTAPFRLSFNLPSNFIKDEAGDIRVNSFKLNYDVDPFRQQYGTASSSNNDTGLSINNASAYSNAGITNNRQGASGSGYYFGIYRDGVGSDFDGSWHTANNWVNLGSNDYLFNAIFVNFSIVMGTSVSASFQIDLKVRAYNSDTGDYFPDSGGVQILNQIDTDTDAPLPISPATYLHIPYQWLNDTIKLQYKSDDVSSEVSYADMNYSYHGSDGHTHPNSYNDDQHTNPNSSSDPGHEHSVSIGDDTSDSASLNASSVDIYLDYWDGSSWVNKYSIIGTGKTLDRDVDLSNGGTYPDSDGLWGIRIYTNSSSPDLVKGVVELKHSMDN